MPGMNVAPTNAMLSDGSIMSDNMFLRNVIYSKNSETTMYRFIKVSFAHHISDSNLVVYSKTPPIESIGLLNATFDWPSWNRAGMDINSKIGDTDLLQEPNSKIQIKQNYPEVQIKYQNIPIDEIGLNLKLFQAAREVGIPKNLRMTNPGL
jgi:hypothetical protein